MRLQVALVPEGTRGHMWSLRFSCTVAVAEWCYNGCGYSVWQDMEPSAWYTPVQGEVGMRGAKPSACRKR